MLAVVAMICPRRPMSSRGLKAFRIQDPKLLLFTSWALNPHKQVLHAKAEIFSMILSIVNTS